MLPQNKLPSTKVSVVVTLGLVVLVGLLALIGISVLMRGISESAPAPVFVAGAAPTQVVETGTAIPPTEPKDATPTPLVIMGVPNEVTPPPTYAVGPTAQFTELLPTSEWLTYEDKQAGFSFQYPPDWYLVTSPEQERMAGYSVSIHSYDPQDPNLSVLGKSGKWPPNYTKMEFALVLPELTGDTLMPNESIADWARRSPAVTSEERIISEETIQIDGVEAFRQTVESKAPTSSVIYLPVDKYIMHVVYPYEKEETLNTQVVQAILASIRISK
ncbi:hypothetical protein FBQ82_14955 [Anaerolineae bacterium CFX7]|nr:hypothetical protein [Anaerolineae bacterium CFX7]